MKKIILFLLIVALSTSFSMAQSVAPKSVLDVRVVVEKESITAGPYARFSQQYLGVIPALNDKTTYSIVGGDIISSQIGSRVSSAMNLSESSDKALFLDLGINPIVSSDPAYGVNRTAAKEKSLQEMASDAATTIFTLRKRRFDLVTGDSGPEAFGAGMEAAIKEMARIENAYLELFVGKKEVSYQVYHFSVAPVDNKFTYSLCRFSAESGILDIIEQGGEVLILSLVDQNIVQPPKPFLPVKGVVYQSVFIPDMCSATITLGTKPIVTKAVEVYQFGVSAQVAK